MSKHTQGPWINFNGQIRPANGTGRSGGYAPLAKIHGDKRTTNNEINAANARLIAAAPDLLAIAKDVLGMLQNCSVTSGVCCCGEEIDRHSRAMDCGHTPVDSGAYYAQSLFKDVTAAIAKATGKA